MRPEKYLRHPLLLVLSSAGSDDRIGLATDGQPAHVTPHINHDLTDI
jgi:hypothetical protein